jgi:hypothetical protein
MFLVGLATAIFRLDTDSLKVALTGAGYTPDVNSDMYLPDVTDEVTGPGYIPGGLPLAGVSLTYDTPNMWAQLTAAPVTWAGATFTCRRAVLYQDTGDAGTSRLIGHADLGADQVLAARDFTLNWAEAVLRLRPGGPG